VDITVWLLRRHILQQLHHFFVEFPDGNGDGDMSNAGSNQATSSGVRLQQRRGRGLAKGAPGQTIKYYDRRAQYQVIKIYQCCIYFIFHCMIFLFN
jgi:hypothetical protein